MAIVCFHNENEENGYLSNWYPSTFSINGIRYSSMEQYMMYQKAIEFESGHCKWRMRDTATGTIVQDWVQLY